MVVRIKIGVGNRTWGWKAGGGLGVGCGWMEGSEKDAGLLLYLASTRFMVAQQAMCV